jgi:hypothetical protein
MSTGNDSKPALVGSEQGAGGLWGVVSRGIEDNSSNWTTLTLAHTKLPYNHFGNTKLQMCLTRRLLGTYPLELLSGLAIGA